MCCWSQELSGPSAVFSHKKISHREAAPGQVLCEFTVMAEWCHLCVLGEVSMNSQRFVSIRIKLLSLLFICILVPFLVYWFFSYEYIKTSLDEEFVSQTTDTMRATGNSISDYVKLVDYTARGLYFNSEVMDILSEKEQSVSSYRLLQTESRIFDFLQTL